MIFTVISNTYIYEDVKLIANFEELDPVPLTVTGTFTVSDKIYDGTVTAIFPGLFILGF